MKNCFKIFTLALALAVLCTSCKGDPGIPGAPGRDGACTIKSVLVDVYQENWAYSYEEDNNYFYATVPMPEISESVFDKGLVKMYRVYDFNSKNCRQTELPYVRLKEGEFGGNIVFWTETVDYEYGIGGVTIYFTASDFDYEIDETFVPEPMQFRCVIMY